MESSRMLALDAIDAEEDDETGAERRRNAEHGQNKIGTLSQYCGTAQSGVTDRGRLRLAIARAIARAIFALLRGTLAAPPGAAADRRGGCQGSAQRLSARFIATKNPDGERPAFSETGFLAPPAKMPTAKYHPGLNRQRTGIGC